MTKYFDKLLKIKFYILFYLKHGKMKNNAIWGMKISFEIC